MGTTKDIAERLATIQRHRVRRQILQAAREAEALGKVISSVSVSKRIGVAPSNVSYHIGVLRDEGALELINKVPRRGSFEHLYALNKRFLRDASDSIAMDRVAELVQEAQEGAVGFRKLIEIVEGTGCSVQKKGLVA